MPGTALHFLQAQVLPASSPELPQGQAVQGPLSQRQGAFDECLCLPMLTRMAQLHVAREGLQHQRWAVVCERCSLAGCISAYMRPADRVAAGGKHCTSPTTMAWRSSQSKHRVYGSCSLATCVPENPF